MSQNLNETELNFSVNDSYDSVITKIKSTPPFYLFKDSRKKRAFLETIEQITNRLK